MQAIYDLVGDKIRDIFDAQVVSLLSYEAETDLLSWHYFVTKSKHVYPAPRKLYGIYQNMVKTREPLVINDVTPEVAAAHGAIVVVGDLPKSFLSMPLIAGDETKGFITVQSVDRQDAFSQSDVRLLTTLASSMSVALENARLFDETQRLLKETEQRAAELALINSVQQALASKLDMQAIYDLVGDKIREIFDAQIVQIGRYDLKAEMVHYHYVVEKGQRFFPLPHPFIEASRRQIQGQTLLLNNRMAIEPLTLLDTEYEHVGERAKSILAVPLAVGGQVRGFIDLQNVDRENAFTESDVRLLTTLASSMSVALENARLFDETQQRNREISEALEQQTATSDILRVISSSPTGVQPVLDAVAENAARVCSASDAIIVRAEGNLMRRVAHFGALPLVLSEVRPISRNSIAGRVMLEGRTIHVADVLDAAAVQRRLLGYQRQAQTRAARRRIGRALHPLGRRAQGVPHRPQGAPRDFGRELRRAAGRTGRAGRAVRLRQVHAAAHRGGPAPADRGGGALARRADRGAARRSGDGVPKLRAVPLADRSRQCRAGSRGAGRCPRRAARTRLPASRATVARLDLAPGLSERRP